jgi:hypothetical protein
VDYGSTESETNVNPVQMSTNQGSDLRFSFRLDNRVMLNRLARLRGSALQRLALGRAIVILALAITVSVASVQKSFANVQNYNTMNIKLYAYNKLNWNDFQCYNWLIYYESRWNYKARNGSHYGLGQMRSKWYGTLNPYRQIDVHLDYIEHRYNGKPCKALEHWENKGWH